MNQRRTPKPKLRTALELVGLELDLRTVGAEWEAPAHVEIEGRWLTWNPKTPGRRLNSPSKNLLLGFANLARESDNDFDKAVLRYARRWGVLGLCEHDLPGTHGLHRSAPRFADATRGCHGWRLPDGCHAEPVEPWRVLARQADAMLCGAVAINDGEPVSPEGCAALKGLCPPGFWPRNPVRDQQSGQRRRMADSELVGVTGAIGPITMRVFRDDKDAVAFAVRRWLDMADIRPVFTWSDRTDSGFGARTLFGALALELVTLLGNRVAQPKVCAYCNLYYEPKPRERRASAFCGSEECNRMRWAKNSRARRAGDANVRGPYQRG